jgi:hypothetical protein
MEFAGRCDPPPIAANVRLHGTTCPTPLAEIDVVLVSGVACEPTDGDGGVVQDRGDSSLLLLGGIELFSDRGLKRAARLVDLRHDAGNIAVQSATAPLAVFFLKPGAGAGQPLADFGDLGENRVGLFAAFVEIGAACVGDRVDALAARACRRASSRKVRVG